MNICRVSRGFLPRRDGWSVHAFSLSEHQAALGHTVLVLQPYWPPERRGRLAIRKLSLPFANALGWKVTGFLFGAEALPVVIQFGRNHGLDVLHLHGDILEACLLGSWARVFNVPVVLTLHSTLNRRLLYRRLARRLFRMIDGFIAVSPAIRDQLRELEVNPNRIAVISSGVDTRQFGPPTPDQRRAARSAVGLRDNETMVVSVGRLDAVKGFDTLLRSAGIGFPSSVRIIVVGEGPDGRALRRKAADLPNVQFVGSVDHRNVVAYLHAADVFVLASVDLPGMSEGMPTALLEAMACGLPVVCTNSGGMRYIVRDGENGLVVPQRDAIALRAALATLHGKSELRRLFGERNIALARERDWRRVAQQVTAFYGHVRDMKEVRERAGVLS